MKSRLLLASRRLSPKLVLLAILVISAFFRFYKLTNLFFFSLDEEVIALNIRRITTGNHFPSIGVNAADTGLYVGPLYFYAAAPLFALLENQPIAGAIFSGIIGLGATLTLYLLGKEIGGPRLGGVLGFLHAASLPVVLFERKFFNPQPAILLVGLIFFSLLKVKRDHRYLHLLAMLLGLIIHLNLVLTVFIPVSFVWLWREKMKFKPLIWAKSLAIFLIFLTPLIFFDVRHQFQLTQAATNLLTPTAWRAKEPLTLQKLTFPLVYLAKLPAMKLDSPNIIQEFATCREITKNFPHILGWVFLILASYAVVETRNQTGTRLGLLSLAAGTASLWLYPGRIQEYYGVMLAVPYILLSALGLNRLLNRSLLATGSMLSLFFGLNLYQLFIIQNPHSLARKYDLV